MSTSPIAELPSDVDALRRLVLAARTEVAEREARIQTQQRQIEQRDALIAFLQEWKRLHQSRRFGAHSGAKQPRELAVDGEAALGQREAEDDRSSANALGTLLGLPPDQPRSERPSRPVTPRYLTMTVTYERDRSR